MFASTGRWFDRQFQTNVSGLILAVFRILYVSILLAEVGQLWYFKHLIYDPIPYLVGSPNLRMTLLFFFWVPALGCLLVGMFTRTAAVGNYVFSVIVLSSWSSFGYHADYIYLGVNFLLIFLPVSRRLALDPLLDRLKYSRIGNEYHPDRCVRLLAINLLLFVGLGLVYFDSLFWKATSELWMQGLGLWLPASLPFLTWNDVSPILDLKPFVLFGGYLTLLYEGLFLFLFWFSPFRIPLFLVGFALHLGIAVVFPLPLFGLLMTCLLLLLLPPSWFAAAHRGLGFKAPRLTVFYDEHCTRCLRTKIFIEHFDFLSAVRFRGVQSTKDLPSTVSKIPRKDLLEDLHSIDRRGRVFRGVDTYARMLSLLPLFFPIGLLLRVPLFGSVGGQVYRRIARNRMHRREDQCLLDPSAGAFEQGTTSPLRSSRVSDLRRFAYAAFFLFCVISQAVSIAQSPTAVGLASATGTSYKGSSFHRFLQRYTKTTSDFFGIGPHGIFGDAHFKGYNSIYAIVHRTPSGQETWLPMFDRDGRPHGYMLGRLWTGWTWRINGPSIEPDRFLDGLRRFTAFWAQKNDIDLSDATFDVLRKRIEVSWQWEEGFLKRMSARPWEQHGTVIWKEKEFSASIPWISNGPKAD